MKIRSKAPVSLLLVLSLGASPSQAAPDLSHIIAGAPIPNGMFPFLVGIVAGNNLICSGSLIRPRWVLTAAHCGAPTDVLISDARPNSRGVDHETFAVPVRSWNPHPGFSSAVFPFANDVALIELASDAREAAPTLQGVPLYTPSTVTLATGPSTTASSMGPALIAGFGFTDPNETQPPPNIANWAPAVGTIAAGACDIQPLQVDQHLCYGPSPNSCSGDSGGPVLRQTDASLELIGVVSVGLDGPCAEFHDVAAYVPGFLDWIEETIASGTSPISLGWELPHGITTGVSNGQGWVYSSAGDIVSVELFVDGKKEATLPCCSERADAPGPLLSGFAGVLNWGRFEPGDHTARLRVTDSAGNVREEERTITTDRVIDPVFFARDASFEAATCTTTAAEVICSGVAFDQGTCATDLRFAWANGKQSLEVIEGCDP